MKPNNLKLWKELKGIEDEDDWESYMDICQKESNDKTIRRSKNGNTN